MNKQSTNRRKRGLRGWNTRDLLEAVVIGAVFGLISIPMRLIVTLAASLCASKGD
jgi:cell division protein FtsN